MRKWNTFFLFSGMSAVLILLPLTGIILQGKAIHPFLEFPPRTRYVRHAPFALPVFIFLGILIVGMVFFIYIFPLLRQRKRKSLENAACSHPFPLWGWIGIGLILISWFIAWTRFPGISYLRPYTFTPLWLGYILVVNGLVYRRKGTCLMTSSPRRFLLLFVVSAFFWWYFEYLNRFVQNWYYIGEKMRISSLEYIIRATFPFSTVLPAVLGTKEYLLTFPWLGKYRSSYIFDIRPKKATAFGLLGMSFLTMFFLGVFPDYLFPMLWISPLVIITCFQILTGQKTVFAGITSGDWHLVVSLSLASLICGFFWEMWNIYALPKWEYAVPFVNAFFVFEMPLLGYTGYLPFGLECFAVASLFGLDKNKGTLR
ncbi:MAG: hypothetical protein JW928_04645 [Candidatus Aureabacteria bacterium]|nr:hypothetical protein [Candidatus Auribacterota bacterium]